MPASWLAERLLHCPTPLRGIVNGLLTASDATEICAVRVPVAVGLKVM